MCLLNVFVLFPCLFVSALAVFLCTVKLMSSLWAFHPKGPAVSLHCLVWPFSQEEPNQSSFPANNSCHGGTRGGPFNGSNARLLKRCNHQLASSAQECARAGKTTWWLYFCVSLLFSFRRYEVKASMWTNPADAQKKKIHRNQAGSRTDEV